ncbi:MAG: hypothetical protein U0791_23105 [Gemmataceae bacterium]
MCRTPGGSVESPLSIEVVRDADGLDAVVTAVRASAGSVGIDCETTGLEPLSDRVRLLQIAAPAAIYVIDLFAVDAPEKMSTLFAALGEVEIVGHNLQFDLRFLSRLGFVPGPVYDTMLASRVLHAGAAERGKQSIGHSLKEVTRRELDINLAKELQASDWSGALTEQQIAYAANDVAMLLPLATVLRRKIETAGLTATAALEMLALLGIAWANGINFNKTAWNRLAEAKAVPRKKSSRNFGHSIRRASPATGTHRHRSPRHSRP